MQTGDPENQQLRLRDAAAGDAALLAFLHTESWRSAYATLLDPDYLANEMEGERSAHWLAHLPTVLAGLGHIYIAERAGETLGFVCVLRERDPDWGGYVDNLHVRPHLRGAGIGKVLLDAALGWLTRPGRRGRTCGCTRPTFRRAASTSAKGGATPSSCRRWACRAGTTHALPLRAGDCRRVTWPVVTQFIELPCAGRLYCINLR